MFICQLIDYIDLRKALRRDCIYNIEKVIEKGEAGVY